MARRAGRRFHGRGEAREQQRVQPARRRFPPVGARSRKRTSPSAAPLVVCFNGITGYKWFLQYAEGDKRKEVALGEQPERIGESRVFVAPNPSPANASYSLDDITSWYRLLAALVARVKEERPWLTETCACSRP